MYRTITAVIITICIGTLFSCSATQSTLQSEGQQAESVSPFPSWYQQQTIVDSDSVLLAYTMAIDSDSASAVAKAVDWAETELSTSVAATVEEMRSESEDSGEPGVADPEFLFTLAQMDVVRELAATTNTAVETVEGYESHRSYAEVQLPKEELLEAIEQQLASYKKAWNAMKESQAFKEFSL